MKPGMGNETKHRNETEWEMKRRPFTEHENCFQELIALPNIILMLMPRWKIRLNVPHADDVYCIF